MSRGGEGAGTVGAPVVALREVRKSFGSLTVLDGVSFEVQRGEVTTIIGRSGSGKSTALRCIDRLETINSGEIIVCGHRVSDPDVDLRALRLDAEHATSRCAQLLVAARREHRRQHRQRPDARHLRLRQPRQPAVQPERSHTHPGTD